MDRLCKPVPVTLSLTPTSQLELNDLLVFPHNMDGFHIWEAGIVLARFIIYNRDLFFKSEVLELGTGVGIVGIAALKYTKARTVILSDYRDDVLQNAEKNIVKNAFAHKHVKNEHYEIKNENCTLCGLKRGNILNLDWNEYKKFNLQFDIIIASDVIYKGAPLGALASLVKKCLKTNGQAYILVPEKREAVTSFLKEIDRLEGVKWERIELLEGKYYNSPMEDEKKGFSFYPGLREMKFYVYIFTKVGE